MLLANDFPLEIISVDSRQVYKYMDIGTAKPPLEFRQRVPHHLIDIMEPDQKFNAGKFVEITKLLINPILKRGNIPLFVGGTGMYIFALEHGLFQVEVPEEIRISVLKDLTEKGISYLYNYLKEIDPETAVKLHPNDKQRILRSIEVFKATQKPISFWQKYETQKSFPYNLQKFILMPERNFLYSIINERVLEMMNAGLIGEVENLVSMGYTRECQAMNSVGYVETLDYLEGKFEKSQLIQEIQKNTRRYAKRQITWFKKHSGIMLHFSDKKEFTLLHQKISDWIAKQFK